MAREFILTGAPGAGKTLIARQLEVDGIDIVEEAATDVIALQQGLGIAEPHVRPGFVEDIARLQLQRMERPARGGIRVSDRSVVCTLALAEYLGHPVPAVLERAIAEATGQFERRVLFVELLGFMVNTEARRISLEESRRFETFHVAAYERLGFQLVRIPALPLGRRMAAVHAALGMNGN